MKRIVKQRFIILILAILFAAPGLLALVLFKHPQWLSLSTTNQGELLQPPVRLAKFAKKHWHLVLWYPAECGQTCRALQDKLAAIRLALGRNFYEVNVDVLSVAEPSPLLTKQPRLFIADRDSYFVLSYPTTATSDAIFHDIKQLLARESA